MSEQHTPGPWKKVGREVRCANNFPICRLRVAGDLDQINADAELIAAAPTIRTALSLCRDLLKYGGYTLDERLAAIALADAALDGVQQ